MRRGELLDLESNVTLNLYGSQESSKFDVRFFSYLHGFIVIERYPCTKSCCIQNFDSNHWDIIMKVFIQLFYLK